MPRPFVYVNMASTVDGKITSAQREYPRFTSSADRERMDRLRAEADAILVGAGTLRADDPALHVRDAAMQVYRESLGKPRGLIKILVSASLEIAADSHFFEETDGGERIVATIDDAPRERISALEQRCTVWPLGSGRVDPHRLLERLEAHGVERLLVEGGGELNWLFVEADLVDEFYLTLAPALLGGRDAPTLLEGPGLAMQQQRRLRLVDVQREGDELYCRYAVQR